MKGKTLERLNSNIAKIPTAVLLASIVAIASSQSARALSFFTERSAFNSNDRVDWSSLGPVLTPPPDPSDFLPFSFSATSQKGLNLDVDIPFPPLTSGITPPFVFQTLPSPTGIPTNFAPGDFILFTGLQPGIFPAPGNPGPLTITFEQPVFGAGTQIAVDDTPLFTGFISAFDKDDNLLGEFSAEGTSSLALDNSALFLGVRNDIPNISKIVLRSSAPNRAVGINQLSIERADVGEPNISPLGWVFAAVGAGMVLQGRRGVFR
ncbi:MAG: hypothetical protein SW833_03835 [Cyanobacteriota bacterium]|nr:hypothetical protein [Cyanobacteriota bacterium]